MPPRRSAASRSPRGVLRAGCFADIVIFDPETIADVATYAEPRQYPAGIDYVIVNGAVAAEHGRQTDARSGRLLRRDALLPIS